MRKLIGAIKTLIESGFSGYIKINFSQGSLGRVEKSEECEIPSVMLNGDENEEKKKNK